MEMIKIDQKQRLSTVHYVQYPALWSAIKFRFKIINLIITNNLISLSMIIVFSLNSQSNWSFLFTHPNFTYLNISVHLTVEGTVQYSLIVTFVLKSNLNRVF